MHRMGLSETVLVFPEHLAFIPHDEQAARLQALRRCLPEKRMVVEVGSIEAALAAARAGADVLQLERFRPEQVPDLRRTLPDAAGRPLLAPAGGVTVANAAAHARAGADLPVTSAPYFARPAEIRVSIGPQDA